MLKETSKISFQLTHVNRLKTGFEKLFIEQFDLILLDLNLADSRGFDTFIRTCDQAPKLPIIILSGFGNEEVAVRAVREGAQDYLIKGEIDGRILARSIYYAIERKKTEKKLMKTQKDLRKLIEWHEEELKETELKLKSEMDKCKLLESRLDNALGNLKIEKFKLNTIINKLPVGILIVDASSGKPLIKNKKLDEIWEDCTEMDELAEYCYYNGSHVDGKHTNLKIGPLPDQLKMGKKLKIKKLLF